MTFKTQLAADLDTVFFNADEFADAATYTPHSGAAQPVTLVRSEEDQSLTDPEAPGDSMIVLARVSEITTPARGDIFMIAGETWYFTELVGGSAEGIWHIKVSRSARRVLEGRRL